MNQKYEPVQIDELLDGSLQGRSPILNLFLHWTDGQSAWYGPATGEPVPYNSAWWPVQPSPKAKWNQGRSIQMSIVNLTTLVQMDIHQSSKEPYLLVLGCILNAQKRNGTPLKRSTEMYERTDGYDARRQRYSLSAFDLGSTTSMRPTLARFWRDTAADTILMAA